MQSEIIRVGLVVGAAALAAAGGYAALTSSSNDAAVDQHRVIVGGGTSAAAPPPTNLTVDPRITPPPWGQGAPPPLPLPEAIPMTEGPIEPMNAPSAVDPAPSLPRPTPSLPGMTVPEGPGIDPHDPGTWPAHLRPPTGAGEPLGGGAAPPSEKVISYFQKTKTQLDTKMAFGFVLFPRAAVTDAEKATQKNFCEIVLASLDFMTPGAVTAAISERHEILATYWPIDSSRNSFEVSTAFAARDCNDLIAWYDHKLARSLAARAGVSHLGGPLLITWPSSGASERDRDPLVVDFSKANHERATKALQYWFRQLRNKPALWTSRIREGTIRAELADAVNDTAGVMLAVLSGKWDSFTVASSTATP